MKLCSDFIFMSVDINEDCSVVIFDRYYMLSFRTIPVAEHVLTLAHRLRTVWSVLTNQRVQMGIQFSDQTSVDDKVWVSDEELEKLPSVIQKIVKSEIEIRQAHTQAPGPLDKRQYQMEIERLCGKSEGSKFSHGEKKLMSDCIH